MSVSHIHSAGILNVRTQSKPPAKPAIGHLETLRFGSAGPVPVRNLLEQVDFTAVGASPVKQIALVFSSLIAWRLLAANERRRTSVSRRWNELRENLMRDLLGFAFWFLGVPVLQRLYLGAVAKRNPKLNDILMQRVQAQPEQSKGVLGWLKSNNPLNNHYIPSSQQVKDQMHQALHTLEQAGFGVEHAAYKQICADYSQLVKHRNFATAIGLGSTILLLGVGINLLNFYLTRKNMVANTPPATPIQIPTFPDAAMRPVYPAGLTQRPLSGQPDHWSRFAMAPVFQAQPNQVPLAFMQKGNPARNQSPFGWPVSH